MSWIGRYTCSSHGSCHGIEEGKIGMKTWVFYGFHVHVGKYYISVPWNLSWVLRNKQHMKTSVSMYSQASMSCYCKWQIVKITKFQNKHSFLHRSFCWNPYIPGTHIMTLVLIGKDLILNVLRSKIEDKKIQAIKHIWWDPKFIAWSFVNTSIGQSQVSSADSRHLVKSR